MVAESIDDGDLVANCFHNIRHLKDDLHKEDWSYIMFTVDLVIELRSKLPHLVDYFGNCISKETDFAPSVTKQMGMNKDVGCSGLSDSCRRFHPVLYVICNTENGAVSKIIDETIDELLGLSCDSIKVINLIDGSTV